MLAKYTACVAMADDKGKPCAETRTVPTTCVTANDQTIPRVSSANVNMKTYVQTNMCRQILSKPEACADTNAEFYTCVADVDDARWICAAEKELGKASNICPMQFHGTDAQKC